MSLMIAYAKLLFDQLGDALARPQIATEAKRRRPLFEHPQQFLPLGSLQLRRRTARWLFAQPGKSLPLRRLQDLADATLTQPDRFSDFSLFPALTVQFQRPKPPSFSPVCRFRRLFLSNVWCCLHLSLLSQLAHY
jgi:hypothetical protein